MRIPLSKILIILILAQCVTSVEFYKSKRAPLKYKEIRRANSFKRQENAENTPMDTVINKNTEQDKSSSDNPQTTEAETIDLPTSTMKPKRRTLKIRTFRKKGENTESDPVVRSVNTNNSQNKISTDNIQPTEDKEPNLTVSTTKPRRRPLSRNTLKKKNENVNNKPTGTLGDKKTDQNNFSTNNMQTDVENEDTKQSSTTTPTTTTTTTTTTLKPKGRNFNAVTLTPGNRRIVKAERKFTVRRKQLDSNDDNITTSTVSLNTEKPPEIVSPVEKAVTSASETLQNYYQSTSPYEQPERTTTQRDSYIPIVGLENYVYAYNGDYHYSYESGDGTKAFESGELKSAEGRSNASGVVGGYSYKDKDGHDISLSYTAGEGGYRPVGAHLPTPPPIPPAIQRVLRILATKTTPEPVTESIDSDY